MYLDKSYGDSIKANIYPITLKKQVQWFKMIDLIFSQSIIVKK